MSMIERVARAICKSRTCEGFMCCQHPAQMGRVQCPVKDGGYDDAARAAIEAMREYTNEMFDAGCLACDLNCGHGFGGASIYSAMIDCALSPTPEAEKRT